MFVFNEQHIRKAQAEISPKKLATILDKFLDSPFHSSYPERATLAQYELNLDTKTARALASNLVEITEELEPILKSTNKEDKLKILQDLAVVLDLFLHSEKQSAKLTYEDAVNKFVSNIDVNRVENTQQLVFEIVDRVTLDFFDEEVFGQEEMLGKYENLPVFDPEAKVVVKEQLPLMNGLDLENLAVTQTELKLAPLYIEHLRTRSEDGAEIFKLRIPVIFIPIKKYKHVDKSAWVDVDLSGIQALVDMAGVNADIQNRVLQISAANYFASIFKAIRRLEKEHNLIVRGDGTVYRKN